jgi:hypothetical protein
MVSGFVIKVTLVIKGVAISITNRATLRTKDIRMPKILQIIFKAFIFLPPQ